MRTSVFLRGAGAVVFLVLAVEAASAQDLREQFGTRSAAAAKALDEGIRQVQQKQFAAALPLLEKAIAEDPNLQMAYYWKALAQIDTGDVDQGLATYKQILSIAEKTHATSVTVDACINAGLTLAKMQEEKQARLWFTKALILDPTDQFKLHWKAFRNMAISLELKGKHLSAAMCGFAGFLANPEKVDVKLVTDMVGHIDDKEELAQILYFETEPPKVVKRAGETKLGEPAALKGIDAPVTQVLADAMHHRMVAIAAGKMSFYLIDSARVNAVVAKEAPGEIRAGSLVAGELYLSVKGAGIVKVDPGSGKVKQTWKLSGEAPPSLAAAPAQGVVMFPEAGELQVLDLDTGNVKASKFSAHAVAADPDQQFCYAYVRKESGASSGYIIVNGRPVTFQRSRIDWIQTALFKYEILNKQLLPAEIRMNAASNGQSLLVSPDGNWVGVVGGGGWRPVNKSDLGTGYGVALFAAADLAQLQGFFATNAYPIAAAVNPVTGQVAAVSAADAKVYDLAGGSQPITLPGPHTAAAAWSPDGRFLYLANKSGLRVWDNTLTAAETGAAEKWWDDVQAHTPHPAKKVAVAAAQPVADFQSFTVKNDRAETLKAIQLAETNGRGDKPIEWLQYEPYQSDKELKDKFSALANKNDADGNGIRIFQLKKLKQDRPPHPGIEFLLGMAYFVGGQLEAAEKAHVAAIQLDQARTNITLEALRCLGQIHKRQDQPQAAAYCYANVLRLDQFNPQWSREALPIFTAAGVTAEADKLLSHGRQFAQETHAALPAGVKLGKLPVVDEQKIYAADTLFAKTAPSVVLIRTASGSGSGVCVGGKGIILTNHHVVKDNGASLRVYPFAIADGKLKRLPALTATILFQSAADDLAILQVANPPASLTPVAVAAKPATEGAKVYAIGSPGLGGGTVLEQSISEGIVSSAARELNGRTYLQHTAAVNPGNSGGPLLNDRCQVIGIVTSKAGLENVSFAIPAAKVREIFESLSETKLRANEK